MLDIDAKDPICAVSTPPGKGGVAIIRVSGLGGEAAIRKIANFLPKELDSHKAYFGKLVDPKTNTAFDEALVFYFKEGSSYTGEMTFEISSHGSEYVTKKIISLLKENGVRHAERGEFTFRSFRNGQMDLVQAESVLSLIDSESEIAGRAAFNQLDGQLSASLKKVEDQLLWVGAQLEAEIDFTEQDISVADYEASITKLKDIKSYCQKLLKNYSNFKLINNGLKLALVGEPNAGKSSLLNALLGYDRSIVSNEKGTTRDFIEAEFYRDNYKVTLVDTAGLRATGDPVESIGIAKTYEALKGCDLVFFLHDLSTEKVNKEFFDKVAEINKNTLLVGTKKDLSKKPLHNCKAALSVVDEGGLTEAKALLDDFYQKHLSSGNTEVIQQRHAEHIKQIIKKAERALTLLEKSESPDLCAFEIKDAVLSIHEILGKKFDDQIMDRVFGDFCLGK